MQHRQMDPKISVSIVFVAAMFMSIMDGTIVNVALPAIGQQFHAPGTSVDAIVVAYLVTLAVIIPVSGWLGDRLGTKRVFLCALALFSLASALCGLANSLGMLIAFRALQGIAGGALTPVGTTLLYRTFPPAQRVQVARILNIPTVLAPASGPIIGGLLVVKLSWHWVFYVNVPIGIAACIFGALYLQELREPSTDHFDFTGFILAGLGLSLAMYALSEGPDLGWAAPVIIITGIAGIISLIAFVIIELRTEQPMLDLRLLSNRLFTSCNLVSFFSGSGFLGVLYAAPLFLQEARGVSALTSGLTTFPEAIGVIIATQFAARIYPTLGPRRLMLAGLSLVAVMMILLSFIDATTNLWFMRIMIFFIGVGMANIFLPAQTAAFANISSQATGQASALYNTQRQVGAALGVAILSSVISGIGATYLDSHNVTLPNYTAYHAAFITAAGLIIIAGAFALLVRDKDAAATMRRVIKKTNPQQVAQQSIATEAG
ncbi:MFS transporter [Ktedonobacteria bacterium brp13]|nr:MFS transporter [Ktedonobacteria bacterium brp13]